MAVYRPEAYRPEAYRPEAYRPEAYRPEAYRPEAYRAAVAGTWRCHVATPHPRRSRYRVAAEI